MVVILKGSEFVNNDAIFFDDRRTLRKVTNFESINDFFEINGMLQEHTKKYIVTLIDGFKLTVKVTGNSMVIDDFS
ncbi:hypothetical protein BIT28_17605 [Photobacterium proteolyticum]|uniref:Uncharacterized protein n=2 Tax=Photobacterium proteolyticum TaxID=1903952 RepID=A0A1Q9GWA7_9GAMM|nr:hypothetical protein BIT28_17605 [Photobacterium proteolyticum]